ncbi:hypothetical protein GUJ93_ZPchr0012g20097 [Zizania palustris]|uniref:RING-type E3 ubiquitin transferase n=1 Tax=Zizania palustris TaxID=103762 RepID=A0A8J6BXP2_ZIZPA|nr:hypothetical protein GUJ93_ZPchr0012g20097 [Zizania palustris]
MSSPPPTRAQPAFPSPAAMASTSGGGGGPSSLVVSNGVLLAAVIFLFMVVVFVFLLYLYAKRYLGANPLLSPSSPSARFLFLDSSPFPRRGIPSSLLRALPVTVYAKSAAAAGGKAEALECAVCLSEVADGEKVRMLPKCDHGFHVECIDMWFRSHETCPLCRAPVGSEARQVTAEGLPPVPREEPTMEFPMFPTNVLFWGTHDDVTNTGHLFQPPQPPPMAAASTSTSSSVRRKENLVIDIPTRAAAADSVTSSSASTPLPATRMPGGADDMRSPVSARLRSLRRLLSRGKQAVVGPSFSPRGGDIEQGLAGSGADAVHPPKTPKTPKTPPLAN